METPCLCDVMVCRQCGTIITEKEKTNGIKSGIDYRLGIWVYYCNKCNPI